MFGLRERLYNAWVGDPCRSLLRSAWALTGNHFAVEERVQDCFELPWRHRDPLRDCALARAQLFRILRHEALTLFYFEDMPVAVMALAHDVAPCCRA
jgi:DNA-directed RNA polymerase specialized sigma24 family protein